MSKNYSDFQSIFTQMDEMMRQMDQFLAGPGFDDSRHDNGWQWPLFPRWQQQPPRLRHDGSELDALDHSAGSADDGLSPRDRLLKRPGELPQVQPMPRQRRDIDLDSEDAAGLLQSPPQLRDPFPGDGGGESSMSSRFSSWSRVEHRVHQPDGTVKRTVTTVGPDGRRRSVSTVETPDGRHVTEVQDEADGRRQALKDRQHQQPRSESSTSGAAGSGGGWVSWLVGPWFGGGRNK